MDDAVIVHPLTPAQDLFEQPLQVRDVPLPVSELVQQASHGLLRQDVELLEECRICQLDREVVIEHQERLAYRPKDRGREISFGVDACR